MGKYLTIINKNREFYPKWEPPLSLVLIWLEEGITTEEDVKKWLLNNEPLKLIKHNNE